MGKDTRPLALGQRNRTWSKKERNTKSGIIQESLAERRGEQG